MKPISALFPKLQTPQKVVITMHQKPDADAMGSSLALSQYLTKKGHEVTVISPTNWAGWVNWMQGTMDVLNYEKQQEKSDAILEKADLLFCLDFNAFHRTKSIADKLAILPASKY